MAGPSGGECSTAGTWRQSRRNRDPQAESSDSPSWARCTGSNEPGMAVATSSRQRAEDMVSSPGLGAGRS